MRDNGPLGVAVYGSASPLLGGNTLVAHDQAGILLDVVASATPRVLGNLLRDNGSAGLVLTGRSAGTVAGNICTGARFGLVLDGAATQIWMTTTARSRTSGTKVATDVPKVSILAVFGGY